MVGYLVGSADFIGRWGEEKHAQKNRPYTERDPYLIEKTYLSKPRTVVAIVNMFLRSMKKGKLGAFDFFFRDLEAKIANACRDSKVTEVVERWKMEQRTSEKEITHPSI